MRYYFAPMEGITGAVFRQIHRRFFPEADRYYMPFLSPTQDHRFTPRERREVLPEPQRGGSGGAPADDPQRGGFPLGGGGAARPWDMAR